MSGPKTSRYALTPQQRRILAEQRNIEHRKVVATENIKRNSIRLIQIGGMFDAEKTAAAEMISRIGNDGGFGVKIDELEQLISPISSAPSQDNSNDVAALEEAAKTISACVAKAEKIVADINYISARNEHQLKNNLQSAIEEGFQTSFTDLEISEEENKPNNYHDIISELMMVRNNPALSDQLKAEIEESSERAQKITDTDFLNNYSVITLKPLLKKYRQSLADYKKYHDEFEALTTEYIALCNLYYYVAQDYICSEEAINALKQEIQRIKEAAVTDDEQSYISECLDEVMEEMGYSVIGSREVTKKNGKHFRNELFTYGEGTAVNVTYSSDGKIAMELGGIDSSDRLPDRHETSMLCEAMDEFCGDFKEIERRLFAKGVVLADRISLLPPDEEYAQIINTSDYEMKTETEKLQVKKQRRTDAKLKTMKE